MKRYLCVAAKAFVSFVLGGSTGAVLPYLQVKFAEAQTGTPMTVDGHIVAQLAIYGAVIAVLGHLAPSPLTPGSCPNCSKEPCPK